MRLLLDTQALLWALQDSKQLGPVIRQKLATAESVYVSPASLYEVVRKSEQGKLGLPAGFVGAIGHSGFGELPVSWEHIERLREVRGLTGTVDRVLVAQAMVEQLVVATGDDAILAAYPGLCLDARL